MGSFCSNHAAVTPELTSGREPPRPVRIDTRQTPLELIESRRPTSTEIPPLENEESPTTQVYAVTACANADKEAVPTTSILESLRKEVASSSHSLSDAFHARQSLRRTAAKSMHLPADRRPSPFSSSKVGRGGVCAELESTSSYRCRFSTPPF